MTIASLTDSFERKINYLRISITDRCNLRCTYCMTEEGIDSLGHTDILTYEEILRFAGIAVRLGISKVRVTGGEPLVRKGVVGFIGELAAMEGVEDLALTTNGVLLGPMAAELKRAGLKRVNVSLDTLNPRTFLEITRRDNLGEVLAGLRAAREAGLDPVKVNVVAMRNVNDEELVDFAEFSIREGFEVRFIEFMPTGSTEWSATDLVTGAQILETLSNSYELTPVANRSAGPSRSYALAGGGRIGIISPLSNHFCSDCNRLRLTAEGKLRSCLFSEKGVGLREILRSGASDAAIRDAVERAVSIKPDRHRLEAEETKKCGLTMRRVGG